MSSSSAAIGARPQSLGILSGCRSTANASLPTSVLGSRHERPHPLPEPTPYGYVLSDLAPALPRATRSASRAPRSPISSKRPLRPNGPAATVQYRLDERCWGITDSRNDRKSGREVPLTRRYTSVPFNQFVMAAFRFHQVQKNHRLIRLGNRQLPKGPPSLISNLPVVSAASAFCYFDSVPCRQMVNASSHLPS